MFTIYECVYKPTGKVEDYLVYGEEQYAWITLNTTNPLWSPLKDIRILKEIFTEDEFNDVGEVKTKSDVMSFIKMLKLIEV